MCWGEQFPLRCHGSLLAPSFQTAVWGHQLLLEARLVLAGDRSRAGCPWEPVLLKGLLWFQEDGETDVRSAARAAVSWAPGQP